MLRASGCLICCSDVRVAVCFGARVAVCCGTLVAVSCAARKGLSSGADVGVADAEVGAGVGMAVCWEVGVGVPMAGLEPVRAFYGPTDFKSDRLVRAWHLLDKYLTRNASAE